MELVRRLESINPSNYELLGDVEVSSPEEVMAKIARARMAFRMWSSAALVDRIVCLRNALHGFAKRKEEFALLESREMGMPITEAKADYDGVLDFANWYLDNAERCLAPEVTFEDENVIHEVHRAPFGVVAVIIPWNYPFLNFVWATFQSLIAGNTVVMKHSEEVPLCGKLIEEVMCRHLPEGVFGEVYGGGEVGEMLASDKYVNKIHFVGSVNTGKALYALAGKRFIPATMELGGSAPGIIMADADIESAVRSVCEYRLSNNGQYCDGLKRLIVHASVFDDVVGRLGEIFAKRRVGVAEDSETEAGPLAAKRQLELLASQVADSVNAGAKVVTGGFSMESHMGGAFFTPTLLRDVPWHSRVWQEEVFGPVLPVMPFTDDDEAVGLANDTKYGLGSYIYTGDDLRRAEAMARRLQTGMVSINGLGYTTPWNPFGGWKHSGMGREHGKYGFHDVTQMKVIARPKKQ